MRHHTGPKHAVVAGRLKRTELALGRFHVRHGAKKTCYRCSRAAVARDSTGFPNTKVNYTTFSKSLSLCAPDGRWVTQSVCREYEVQANSIVVSNPVVMQRRNCMPQFGAFLQSCLYFSDVVPVKYRFLCRQLKSLWRRWRMKGKLFSSRLQ